LFHRGQEVDPQELTIRRDALSALPYHSGDLLDDGVWLLLRLRRLSSYPGQREWFTDARFLHSRISATVDDFKQTILSQDEALARFRPSTAGAETIFDEFSRLRALIQNDGVLSEAEASLYVGQLRLALNQSAPPSRTALPTHSPARSKRPKRLS
jgi:hypothetical protein